MRKDTETFWDESDHSSSGRLPTGGLGTSRAPALSHTAGPPFQLPDTGLARSALGEIELVCVIKGTSSYLERLCPQLWRVTALSC